MKEGVLYRELSDEVLVSKTQSGDGEAFEVLIARYETRLFNFAKHMTLSSDAAEEVLSDSFSFLYEHISSGESLRSFGLSIFAVATQLSRRSCSVECSGSNYQQELPLIEAGSGISPEPVSTWSDSRVKGSLNSVICAMPQDYREVFLLHDVEGWSKEQISEILGVSKERIRFTLYKARLLSRALIRSGRVSSGLVVNRPPHCHEMSIHFDA